MILESPGVHAVVNHLRFAKPLSPETVETIRRDAVPLVRDAGALGLYVVAPEDDHLILVILFADAEAANEAAKTVGGPWMREHIVPLLGAPTERSLGEVLAWFATD